MSGEVDDRQHPDVVFPQPEEDAIRESLQERSPHVTVDDGKASRVVSDVVQQLLDDLEEGHSEAR